MSAAMRSSSPVVTPGFASARHAARISATISPASRIFAVSSGVFSVPPPGRAAFVARVRGVEQTHGDVLDLPEAVDPPHDAAALVVIDDRLRLLEEHVETAADHV